MRRKKKKRKAGEHFEIILYSPTEEVDKWRFVYTIINHTEIIVYNHREIFVVRYIMW